MSYKDIIVSEPQAELEETIQKDLKKLCNVLTNQQSFWLSSPKEASKCVQFITNLSTQLQLVPKAAKKHSQYHPQIDYPLETVILESVEDQVVILKGCIDKMNNAYVELNRKITTFEETSWQLLNNQNEDSVLIRGTPIQPALKDLLQYCYDYLIYFQTKIKQINEAFENFNIYRTKTLDELQKSLKIDLDDRDVKTLLMYTQYIER